MGEEALGMGGGGVAQSVDLTAALEDGGRAHAGADAHGHHAKPRRLAALVHLVEQRRRAPSACKATMVPSAQAALNHNQWNTGHAQHCTNTLFTLRLRQPTLHCTALKCLRGFDTGKMWVKCSIGRGKWLTGAAQRVAQSDSATVGVDPLRVQAQLLHTVRRLRTQQRAQHFTIPATNL